MNALRIVINGVGVAGPALAYWLNQSGHEVLLVESGPRLRTDGYIIDFWGLGYDIAERMGLVDEIRAPGYQVREVRYVDRHGRKRGGFDVDVFDRITKGRFTSVRRSDVSATLYRAIEGKVETLFGDSIAGIEDTRHCVRVSFDHASAREVDLVIGADGLHSRVRQLVFGPESDFEVSLGYHVAAFEVAGYRPRDELDTDAEAAARFYAKTFPDSSVNAVHLAPGDYPSGKKGDVLTVECTVLGIPCLGPNGGPALKHSDAFSFQVATTDQAETDRYWNAIIGNGGAASACGWCRDKWGLSWQITPTALMEAITDPDQAAAKRAFDAMMQMGKIDIATIEAARRG